MRFTSRLLQTTQDIASTFSYTKFLQMFPPQIKLAFGYGSGIVPQKGNEDTSKKMLDFILVVEDSYKWHKLNLEQNNDHYALAGKLQNNETFHKFMENSGAGVHFNTGIKTQGRRLKYGVISERLLIADLTNWDTLYIAGRLHKPIHIIQHSFENSPKLLEGLKFNLAGAVAASLLILPEVFTERDLYLTITGLSYLGDVRMGIAEDSNKVANIVDPNILRFRDLYAPVLNSFMEEGKDNYLKNLLCWSDNHLVQDKSPPNLHELMLHLPGNLAFEMCCIYDREAKHIRDIDEIIKNMAKYAELADIVSKALITIVSQSSKTQTLKNLTTVGPLEAVKYSGQKISKMLKNLV